MVPDLLSMALHDNPVWILSHIRNSFTVSDDTGNSDLVMGADTYPDDVKKLARQEFVEPFLKLEQPDAEDEFRPKSLEIRVGANPLGYRPRCNTEIQLEKLKRDRKNAPNIETVTWKTPKDELSQEDLDELFPIKDSRSCQKTFKKSAQTSDDVNQIPKSLLSLRLDSCNDSGINFFDSFSQFQGDSSQDSKQLRVSLSMCPKGPDGSLPYMDAKVKPTAKVYQVIGYLCYLYGRQLRHPPLNQNIDTYNLYLADDGAVEWDLPVLEHHELISKYGFSDLALVETVRRVVHKHSIKVTLPDGTFTVLQLPTKNITLQEVVDKSLAKRRKFAQNQNFKFIFNLERSDTPGVALDLTSTLSGIDAKEFHLVRQNSKRFTEASNSEDIEDPNAMTFVEASAYKEFSNLKMLLMFKTKINIVCSISEEKIEVMPQQNYGASLQMLNSRARSRTVKIADIVSCQMQARGDHFVIVITYRLDRGLNFTKLKLECADEEVSKEIVNKLKFLIKDLSIEAQKQYKDYRERKIHRRKTIHF